MSSKFTRYMVYRVIVYFLDYTIPVTSMAAHQFDGNQSSSSQAHFHQQLTSGM